jgi:predicted outer membrane protein
VTSAEAAQRAVVALALAETNAKQAGTAKDRAELYIKISEQWDSVAYRLGQIEEEATKLAYKSSS